MRGPNSGSGPDELAACRSLLLNHLDDGGVVLDDLNVGWAGASRRIVLDGFALGFLRRALAAHGVWRAAALGARGRVRAPRARARRGCGVVGSVVGARLLDARAGALGGELGPWRALGGRRVRERLERDVARRRGVDEQQR